MTIPAIAVTGRRGMSPHRKADHPAVSLIGRYVAVHDGWGILSDIIEGGISMEIETVVRRRNTPIVCSSKQPCWDETVGRTT